MEKEFTVSKKIFDTVQEKLCQLIQHGHGKLEITLLDGETMIIDITEREKTKIY